LILGTLAKDDGTLNIIAEEVKALKLNGPAALALSQPSAQDGTQRSKGRSPYQFLKKLRRNAPGARSWG
jgi:hypothetical protein